MINRSGTAYQHAETEGTSLMQREISVFMMLSFSWRFLLMIISRKISQGLLRCRLALCYAPLPQLARNAESIRPFKRLTPDGCSLPCSGAIADAPQLPPGGANDKPQREYSECASGCIQIARDKPIPVRRFLCRATPRNSNDGIPMVYASLTPAGSAQASGESATAAQQTTFDAMSQFTGLLTDPFLRDTGCGAASQST
jgi:hypothetical protein